MGNAEPLITLHVGGLALGRLVPRVAAALDALPALFSRDSAGFHLRDAALDAAERSLVLERAAEMLRAADLVPGWRGEACVLYGHGDDELARFERGAFRTLGLQNRAVHVNGVRADGQLWIARRSPKKVSSPGKLDNLAAGAISAGESPRDCAIRELWEEAGVPVALAAAFELTGSSLRSLRPTRIGYHDEIVYCADLELPLDFMPACQDGEVAEFLCLTPDEAAAALARGEFAPEAGLVLADWLARSERPGRT